MIVILGLVKVEFVVEAATKTITRAVIRKQWSDPIKAETLPDLYAIFLLACPPETSSTLQILLQILTDVDTSCSSSCLMPSVRV